MGPEGGAKGGKLLLQGTPEQLVSDKKSYTMKYLITEI
jgi:excinuclease ABC subunit A